MQSIAVVRPKPLTATRGETILQECATTYNPWYWLTWFWLCIVAFWNEPSCYACGGKCVGHVKTREITFPRYAEYLEQQAREKEERERKLAAQRALFGKRKSVSKKEYLCMKAEWDCVYYRKFDPCYDECCS